MTLFRFTEARDSQASTHEPPSITTVWNASGNNSGAFVRTFALTATPGVATHERGTLYRQDVRVEPVGFELFRVVVPYGPRKREQGEWTFDFDTTGGSLHIRQALETRGRFAAPGKPAAPDMGGAIGVRGDQVDGAEIVIPALKIGVSFKHPAGVITMAQVKALARLTGRTNSAPFMTFAPGESLFLGATGSEGTEVETTTRYQFAMSENIVGEQVGIFANVDKRGWDHVWIRFEDETDPGPPAVPIKKPRWLYVERVYREADLAAALGFG